MNVLEEKTPKGYIVKIFIDDDRFLIFDRNGASVFKDGKKSRPFHPVMKVLFLGPHFKVRNNYNQDLSLVKVSKESLVLPYQDDREGRRKYVFISTDATIDMVPVKIIHYGNLGQLVKEIKRKEEQPGYIIVDESISKNDIIVIKNRCPDSTVLLASEAGPAGVTEENAKDTGVEKKNSEESVEDVDLNMLSQNPVFLARVHLRKMHLSRVKQLMLDFDLQAVDIEYIISFLQTMLANADDSEEIKKYSGKIEELLTSFQLYFHLLQRDDVKIREMIEGLDQKNQLPSYFTLVSKVKLIFPGNEDQLLFTDYENLLWEKSEQLSG
jgi:transcription antitermination factor NusG